MNPPAAVPRPDQIRVNDYTGAGQALTKGSPPANQLGGSCEAQHLWLSLAKLALLAGGGGSGGGGTAPAIPAAATPGAEIQRRLELAEVRERLVELRPSAEGRAVSAKNEGGGRGIFLWVVVLVVSQVHSRQREASYHIIRCSLPSVIGQAYLFFESSRLTMKKRLIRNRMYEAAARRCVTSPGSTAPTLRGVSSPPLEKLWRRSDERSAARSAVDRLKYDMQNYGCKTKARVSRSRILAPM